MAAPLVASGIGAPPDDITTRVAADTLPIETKSSLQILIVDDDRTLREGCASVLQIEGYGVMAVGRGDEAREILGRRKFDIVLLDLYMSIVTGVDLLKRALATNPDAYVIMMTGNPSIASNLEVLHLGAWDYVPKPFSASHLNILVGRAAHAVLAMRRERNTNEAMLTEGGNSDKVILLGTSPVFRRCIDLARRVAQTDASVMITGESGTGKEGLAQLIHRHSRRADKKLVPINCAALPEALLESEMFGHKKGSFTGADRDKPGLLEVANGGTLFLDELTEMSHPIQAKLLRVLQDGVVRRVGSEHQDAVVDVRFISATNKDPQDAVRDRILREDLFYRLRVIPIRIPSLRERTADIPLLANHFLNYYWRRHRSRNATVPTFTADTMEFLCRREWRGNVRELQNVIEHAAVLAVPGQALQPDDLRLYENESRQPAPTETAIPIQMFSEQYHVAKDRLVAVFEKEYLSRLVVRAGGNLSRAARLASIDRTTLYRLMDKHSVRVDDAADFSA